MNSQNNPIRCERPTPWSEPGPLTLDELEFISFIRLMTPDEIKALAEMAQDYSDMRGEGYARSEILAYLRRTYDLNL